MLASAAALQACDSTGDEDGDVVLDFGSDVGVLNYAYALEQLEAAFYDRVITDSSFSSTFSATAGPNGSQSEQAILRDIAAHEAVHADFFKTAIMAAAPSMIIPGLTVDFSSIKFNDRANVLAVAQTFEDLGVTAYDGAGRYIANKDYLTIAGKIVSVEARHASIISGLISKNSISGAGQPRLERAQHREHAPGRARGGEHVHQGVDLRQEHLSPLSSKTAHLIMETNLLSVLEHGAEAVESRRNALAFVGKLAGGAALAMLPFGLAREAEAQSAGDDVAILNYALTLEYLERSFYNQGVAKSGLIAAGDAPLFTMIRDDERKHVDFLAGQLGSMAIAPIPDSAFDFTAGGMFNAFTDYTTFLILAQGFEDTGVRAYKGQAPFITNKTYLTAALSIHAVEARHAAAVRRVRGAKGWIPGDGTDAPAPIKPIYGPGQTRRGATDSSPSEANVTQGGVPLAATAKYTLQQIQEAFDEPLGTATVKNIADPFVIPDLGA